MPIGFNNIIVWRHAEAEDANIELGENDMARVLTTKGQRQAKRMALWLKRHLPRDTMLLCSPAVRAMQTAEALNHKLTINQVLKPGANLQAILDDLASLESPKPNVLLVGHQPWLGQLVTHLTGFSGAELNIKKGAVWWLRLSTTFAHPHYNVIAVQVPSLLSK